MTYKISLLFLKYFVKIARKCFTQFVLCRILARDETIINIKKGLKK
jgi:hypothetical protein